MSFDAFTLAAIGATIFMLLLVVTLQTRAHQESRDQIEGLQRQIDIMHGQGHLPTHASRELCCAIRRLYPDAMHGVDYHLADDGEGPYIDVWLMEEPRPEGESLQQAISAHREEITASAYRENRRHHYPALGDQLDALHKARMGSEHDLQVIDDRIRRVKEKFPKPAACDEACH